MPRLTGETDAQYTRRLMEKHKDAFDRLSKFGYTKEEKGFNDLIRKALDEEPKEVPVLHKLSDIFKRF